MGKKTNFWINCKILALVLALSLTLLTLFAYYQQRDNLLLILNHKNVVQKGKFRIERTSTTKYAIYYCTGDCGGWADRLKGIMSTYIWSLLTERKFLIYMTEPCPMSTYLFDENTRPWSNESIEIMEKKIKTKELSSFVVNKLNSREGLKLVEQLDIGQYKSNIDVLIFQNSYDWLVPLSRNQNIRGKIKFLVPNFRDFRAFRIFRTIYTKIFRFRPEIKQKYLNHLKEAKPNRTKSTLICAQLRLDYTSQFRIADRGLEMIFDFIKTKLVPMAGKSYKIFVTSDRSYGTQRAKEILGNEHVFHIDGMFSNIDRIGSHKNSCAIIEKPILDFHMLQHCDMAIISQSGFGIYGMWTRPRPFQNLWLYMYNGEKIIQIQNATDTIHLQSHVNFYFHN